MYWIVFFSRSVSLIFIMSWHTQKMIRFAHLLSIKGISPTDSSCPIPCYNYAGIQGSGISGTPITISSIPVGCSTQDSGFQSVFPWVLGLLENASKDTTENQGRVHGLGLCAPQHLRSKQLLFVVMSISVFGKRCPQLDIIVTMSTGIHLSFKRI